MSKWRKWLARYCNICKKPITQKSMLDHYREEHPDVVLKVEGL